MKSIGNRLSIISGPYNKIKLFWIIPMISFLFLGGVITIFGDIGLDLAEKTKPNYFHGKYLNYDNLWLLVSIWTVSFPIFLIIATLSLMTHNLPSKQPNLREDKQ